MKILGDIRHAEFVVLKLYVDGSVTILRKQEQKMRKDNENLEDEESLGD